MSWLQIDLELISGFSLRPSNATSPSGKSLLVPTPYSLKMALIDCAIRQDGLDAAMGIFPLIRDLQISIRLPQIVLVSTMSRSILRPAGKNLQAINIAQEVCMYGSKWSIAFGSEAFDFIFKLRQISLGLSYLGQRSGFVQVIDQFTDHELSKDFIDLMTALDPGTPSFELVQRMDDMLPEIHFEHVSRYSQSLNKKAKSRRQYDVTLPYRLVKAGNSYRAYELRSKFV